MRIVAFSLAVLFSGAALSAETIRDCANCPEIIVVPSGQFVMGTPGGAVEMDDDTGETPQLHVTIEKPFGLGKTEVTTQQYADFIRESGYKAEPGCRLWNNRWLTDPKSDWRGAGQMRSPKPTAPAVCVSWNDAQAYVRWLSKKTGQAYRLPSEAEWEYAARAGSTTPRPYGDTSSEEISVTLACDNGNVYDVSAQAEYPFPYPYARCSDKFADLAPVGSFKANAFGLHDMIGNVWEWVEDCYTASYTGRAPDQRPWVWQGGCEARGLRGGSWTSRPADARSAKRQRAPATSKTTYMGFRVARDIVAGETK
jgi:formylglycine-generating enzyme required for sulfatase activity